jgi:hypothetical protein
MFALSSIRSAVTVANPNVPATCHSIAFGFRMALIVGITMDSVRVPFRCSPKILNSGQ